MHYISNIFKAFSKKSYAYELEVKNYLMYIWLILVREIGNYNENSNNLAIYDEERVKLALKYIQNKYKDNISLNDTTMSINISKSECCRSFKIVLNMTQFEYLME